MIDCAEVKVLRSLAEVSEVFLRLAARLRSLADVRSVSHPCWMRTEERIGEDQFRVGTGQGFRFEWYAEGEFVDGRVISFGQELFWHAGEWTIDASVRVNDAEGERVLLELPRRHAAEADDLIVELLGQASFLLDQQEALIRLFSQR